MSDMKLAAIVMLKNEAWDVAEWIAFHLAQGIEHFVMLDNSSTDATVEELGRFDRNLVTVVPFPGRGRQLDCYRLGLRHLPGRPEWVAFIDVDEFLFCPDGRLLPDAVMDYADCGGVCVHWMNFTSNGLIERPNALVTEAFTDRSPEDFMMNEWVKSIARFDCLLDVGVHMPLVSRAIVGEDGVPRRTSIRHPEPIHRKFCINHHPLRSRSSFEKKIARGDSMLPGKVMTNNYWSVRNVGGIADPRATRWLPEISRRLGAAAPPSASRLSDVPRFNEKAQLTVTLEAGHSTSNADEFISYFDRYGREPLEVYQLARQLGIMRRADQSKAVVALLPEAEQRRLQLLNEAWAIWKRPLEGRSREQLEVELVLMEDAFNCDPEAFALAGRIFELRTSLDAPEPGKSVITLLRENPLNEGSKFAVIGLLARRTGDLAEAQAAFEQAVALDPHVPSYVDELERITRQRRKLGETASGLPRDI